MKFFSAAPSQTQHTQSMAMELSLAWWIIFLSHQLEQRWVEILLAYLVFASLRWYARHKNDVLVSWPVIRMLPTLVCQTHRINDWATATFKQMGRATFSVQGPVFAGLDLLITCDLRNIEYITKTNFENFPKGREYNMAFEILGDGILNVDFDLWRAQRRAAHERLGSSEFRSFSASTGLKMVEESLVPVLQHLAGKGAAADLQDVLLRLTFDTGCATMVGWNLKYLTPELPPNKFAAAIDEGMQAVFHRIVTPVAWWKLTRWLGVGRERRLSEAWKVRDSFLAECISLKREERRRGVKASDLLSIYMNSSREETAGELPFDDEEFLRDSIMSFIIAAVDTTASVLAWFFWLVSNTPRAEAKILEELTLVYASKNRGGGGTQQRPCVFADEEIKGLVYLHATLCETLRLYPSVPLDFKGVMREDVLPDGTVVRPGTRVAYSIYSVGRMEWIWGEDCMEFKPERWIDENGRLRREFSYKFLAFNAGPRTCLGKEMSFTQAKQAAAATLFNYRVEVVEGHPVVPTSSVVLHMKHGLMVRIKERAHQSPPV